MSANDPVMHDPLSVTTGSRTVVERDRELDSLLTLVAGIGDGHGDLAVLAGPAGFGKTRLLEFAASEASRRQVCVLRARASELEQGFTFGVVRQLFGPLLHRSSDQERLQLLDGSAATADIALSGAPPLGGGPTHDAGFAAMQGLYWLLANLAERGPLLLVVDDVHWADLASQRFLTYLGSRLAGLPVGLVVALRTPLPPESPLVDLLLAVPHAVLDLGPLGADAADLLLAETLGGPPDEVFREAFLDATGGVPFYVAELLRELAREGIAPTRAEAERVSRLTPASVVRAITARVARTSPEALAVTRALAILGDDPEPQLVVELADVTSDEAFAVLDQLERHGILAGGGLAFSHPIVQNAVLADLSATERGRLHAAAAQLLQAHGAPASTVAAQLLRAPRAGDPAAVGVLRTAAGQAAAVGGSADAIVLLERALAEPPPDDEICEVLLQLGAAELAAGHPMALRHLQDAYERSAGTPLRPAAVQLLVGCLYLLGRNEEAAELLGDALDEFADADSQLRLELSLDLLRAQYIGGLPYGDLLAEVTELEKRPEVRASPTAQVAAAVRAMKMVSAEGPAEDARSLARSAWGGGALLAALGADGVYLWPPLWTMVLSDDLPGAREAIEQHREAARREVAPLGLTHALLLQAVCDLRAGALRGAEAAVLDGIANVRLYSPMLEGFAVGYALEILVARGDLTAAQDVLDGYTTPEQGRLLMSLFLVGRGTLRLAQRRWVEARDDLRLAGEVEQTAGPLAPTLLPWRSRLAVALASLGERQEAARLATEELAAAEAHGSVFSLAVALRTVASVSGTRDERRAHLERALELLEPSPFALELARVHTDLGVLSRAAGETETAREHLRLGMDGAQRCGAAPLAERAREELVAAGARPRRLAVMGVDALTPSELRICQRAAAGRSNREIAQELFVTVKTVEVHLTSSYRKLGISGRAELEQALVAEAATADDQLE